MTLEQALKEAISGEVRFGDGDRALYASDSSNYRHVPRGLVLPQTVEEIAACVEICNRHNTPIVHRGGGTGLAGQTVGPGAVIIDSSKYCRGIVSLDPDARLATVEPGCVLDDLRSAASQHGLTFGPDPATHNHCTLGGMIGNNSCGVHSIMAGRTLDNVQSLEIMTADGVRMTLGKTGETERTRLFARPGREGQIWRDLWALQQTHADLVRQHTPHIPRLVSGYRLEQLLPENGFNVARALVGSESTCVTVLRATLNLIPDPKKQLIVAGFDTMAHAADSIPAVLATGPVACEAMDDRLVGYMKKEDFRTDALEDLPAGEAWLLIEAGGEDDEAACNKAEEICTHLRRLKHLASCRIVEDQTAVTDLWKIRKAGLGATAWVPGMDNATWPGWEDSAVHPDRIGEYTRKLRTLLNDYDYDAAMYGHFGDGLIHMRVNFGLDDAGEVVKFRRFIEDAASLVISLGGTLSGEHGDGQARSELLPSMYGPDMMEAFANFKAIWDPDNLMNPGNIIRPRKLDADLRFGPSYRPEPRETVFQFPDQGGDFRGAAIRCVGVGECRRMSGGTMCPSYRATKEEKHSTRGRARLFQEMLQGNPVRDGWRAEPVREALDLCLSCKACKHECPVNVDMATYKAEFYHHYYQGRLRPPVHYAVGNIPLAARLGSYIPALANFAAGQRWAKKLVGIHPERQVPRLAQRSFRSRWSGTREGRMGRVILWTDTFNNYFSPQVLEATANVLAQTGYSVEIPKKHLCCGRPFYDFGMLSRARRHLHRLMDALAPLLEDENSFIVGTEPSCITVFRDELPGIFPDDPRAKRLSERSMMLGDFLTRHTDYTPPDIEGRIMMHGHCHHKTVLGIQADADLIRRTGADVEVLDSGCCGMAGSFGYETEKYSHSVDIANQVLLPAIRGKAREDILVANGFSCRSQVADLAQADALTLPELLSRPLEERQP